MKTKKAVLSRIMNPSKTPKTIKHFTMERIAANNQLGEEEIHEERMHDEFDRSFSDRIDEGYRILDMNNVE